MVLAPALQDSVVEDSLASGAEPLKRLQGRVLFADGRPAEGVGVICSVEGLSSQSGSGGRLEMEIPEELLRASVHLDDARFAVKLADGVLALDLAGSWPSQFTGRTDTTGRLVLDHVPALEPLIVSLLADGRWTLQSVDLDALARVEFMVDDSLPEQQWTISGIVIDGLGEVVEGARVGMPLASVRSDAAGKFELTLSAASVKLEDPLHAVAVGRGSRLEVEFGRTWIESCGSLDPLRLILEAPRSLAGRVTWSDGSPAVGFSVQPDNPAVLRHSINPPATLEGALAGTLGTHETTTDEGGLFELASLTRETYRLRVQNSEICLRHVTAPISLDRVGTGRVEVVLDANSRARRLLGRLEDRNGRAVAGACIHVRSVLSSSGGLTTHSWGPETIPGDDGVSELDEFSGEGAELYIESATTMPQVSGSASLAEDGVLVVSRACPVLVEWTTRTGVPDRVGFVDADGVELVSVIRRANSTSFGKRIPFPSAPRKLRADVDSRAVEVVCYRDGEGFARWACTPRPDSALDLILP